MRVVVTDTVMRDDAAAERLASAVLDARGEPLTSRDRPVEVMPVPGLPEVALGDDLASLLAPALRSVGVRDEDVVVVTSKMVAKAEGRLVAADDPTRTVAAETARIVARRGDLVIAETSHGYVCANAGVDASNVDAGTLALLPTDPDGSARRLREELEGRLGVRGLAVVVSDTFGRAWRVGVVNVAIGADGLPSLVDLRGRSDDRGRTLETTEIALADEIAAAGGLVMGKDARIPVAIVRGVDRLGGRPSPASALVRPAADDLFSPRRCRPCTNVGRSVRSARATWRPSRSTTRSAPRARPRRRITPVPGGSRCSRPTRHAAATSRAWHRRGGRTSPATAPRPR